MSPAAEVVKALLYASLIVTKPKPRLKALGIVQDRFEGFVAEHSTEVAA